MLHSHTTTYQEEWYHWLWNIWFCPLQGCETNTHINHESRLVLVGLRKYSGPQYIMQLVLHRLWISDYVGQLRASAALLCSSVSMAYALVLSPACQRQLLFKSKRQQGLFFVIFCAIGCSCEQDPIIPLSQIGGTLVFAPKVQGFRVFKVDYWMNNPRLVEIGVLGDRILFVSKYSIKLISSAATNCLELNTVEANSIYFAFHHPCLSSPLTTRKMP